MKMFAARLFCLIALGLPALLSAQLRFEAESNPVESPDGTLLLDRDFNSLRVFTRDSRELRFVIPGDNWPRLFSKDGTTLYYSNAAEGISSLNLETGAVSKIAAVAGVEKLILADEEQTLIIASIAPRMRYGERVEFRKVDLGSGTVETFATLEPQKDIWLNVQDVLQSRDPSKIMVLFQEAGPTHNIHEPFRLGDFVFADVSIEDGSTQIVSRFKWYEGHPFSIGARWVGDDRKLLEQAYTGYFLIDPYKGEVVREIMLPGVNFRLDDPGRVLGLRIDTKSGAEKYYRDLLESGTLKTIENTEVADKKALYSLARSDAVEFPSDPSLFKYEHFTFHPTKPEFFATTMDESVHFYRATTSGLKFQDRGKGAFWAEYSPSGDAVFYEGLYDSPTGQAPADEFPSATGTLYQDPQMRTADPVYSSPPVLSPSKKWLIKTNNRASTLHKYGEPAIIGEISEHNGDYNTKQTEYRFSKDERALFRINYKHTWVDDNRVYVPTAESLPFNSEATWQETTWSVPIDSNTIVWIDQAVGSQMRLFDYTAGKLISFDATTGAKTVQPVEGFDPAMAVGEFGGHQWDFRERTLYVAVGSNIHSIDLSGETPVATVRSLASSIKKLHRYGDERHLVAQLGTGSLVFLDSQSDKLPLAMTLDIYSGAQGDQLAYTLDQRFDAGGGVIENAYLLAGTRPVWLASIADRNLQPGLMTLALGADAVTSDDVLEEYIQPPAVTTSTVWTGALTRAIQYSAVSNQYPLKEIALYHNGKLSSTIKAEGSEDRSGFEVELLLEQNQIEIIATNTADVSSRAEVIVIDPPEALIAEAKAKRRPPQLHIVAIGVNTYRNPEYNLNYAEADAASVLEKMKAANADLFETINTHHLKSEGATGRSILDALDQVRATALPHDVFVFYFAGHGVMSKSDQQFYLVPHDVTRIYGESQSLTENGLSANRLRDISATIKAQKQLFILDACNSGGALQAFTQRGANREKAVAQLARSTGTHWITASSDSQFATEFADLGHGAFTYAMLQALGGEADTGDQRVTVNELKAYLESELPEITKKHRGLPQYPASYGSGQDFPIALTF